MDGDEGAADDELYDDLEEGEEEEDLDDIDSDSLNEATGIFSTMLVPGDVILFENDLPDNYSEEE